jgi:hypothetical protein
LLYYLIASPKAYSVCVSERAGEKWKYRTAEGLETVIVLPQMGLTLPMNILYEGVTLEHLSAQ